MPLTPSEANKFIQNRKCSVTDNRIKHILWYVLECYQILVKDNISYSKKSVKEKTTYKFEDYLKFEFLDNYLIPNKKLITDKISELEQINFSGETQKNYIDSEDGKEKPDKIDVYINKLGLRNEWNNEDENVYFAIECKRIKQLSDTKGYIEDIENFANRKHTNFRLPFEGQIAFIENQELSHKQVSDEVNTRLDKHTQITTNFLLKSIKLHDSFDNSYISNHKRNFNKALSFSLYHLMLDYSKIVVN